MLSQINYQYKKQQAHLSNSEKGIYAMVGHFLNLWNTEGIHSAERNLYEAMNIVSRDIGQERKLIIVDGM